MTIKRYKVGPGTFKLLTRSGDTAQEGGVDFSCQITSTVVEWDDDTEDPLNTLCGDEEPGDTTWTATISGEMLQDAEELVPWTWVHKGEKWDSEFVPNTEQGKKVVGAVVVKPLSFGGDVKTTATTEFEWSYSGEPTIEDVADEEPVNPDNGDTESAFV